VKVYVNNGKSTRISDPLHNKFSQLTNETRNHDILSVIRRLKMTTVVEIEKAVQALPEEEFDRFSSWFDNYEQDHWDKQIERDQKSGPLHDLMVEAKNDFKAGKCTPL
jgi:hypothetical protein